MRSGCFDKTREVVIRPNEHNRKVDRLLFRSKARSAVFVTAWNPCSRAFSRIANEQRHRELRSILRRRGLRYLEGEGRDMKGHWSPERSFLVFGVSKHMAEAFGRAWHQNAVVYVELARSAQLLTLRRFSDELLTAYSTTEYVVTAMNCGGSHAE